MALFELRTYTLYVGKMGEATLHYSELGWPALQKGGFDAKLVGHLSSDTGTLNQLVHLCKFDDDADRRNHWATLSVGEGFRAFVAHLRPPIMKQENKLLLEAPWGPHPLATGLNDWVSVAHSEDPAYKVRCRCAGV